MPVFSVEQIMAFKDRFTERPYPDFSLAEICRRKTQAAKLSHTEGAWVARKAVSTEEAVSKHVRSALNKLNLSNYDAILSNDLRQPWLLEETNIGIFVRLVFEKALTEPSFSAMYAKLCMDMSRFETEVAAAAAPPSPSAGETSAASPRKSKFRESIIRQAQGEFKETENEAARLEAMLGEVPPATEEEEVADSPLSKLARRKRANIKFVGELFTIRVVSMQVMGHTMSALLKLRRDFPATSLPGQPIDKALIPSELDIEVVTELIMTVGRHMEADDLGRAILESVFTRINALIDLQVYTHRIHFKLMGTVEYRENGWMSRAHSRSLATPMAREPSTSLSSTTKKASAALPAKSPGVFTPTRSGKGVNKFPESPAPSGVAVASPVVPAAPVSFKNALVGAASAAEPVSTFAQTAAQFTSGSTVPPPVVKIEKRITEMLKEFEADGSCTSIPNWSGRFSEYGLADDELATTVATELVSNACLTTARNAQQIAANCITIGMNVALPDVVRALGRFLARVVEEALQEDVPKVFDRLVTVIREIATTSRSPPNVTVAKVTKHYELVCLACMNALGVLKSAEDVENPVEEVIRLWQAMPIEPLGEDAVSAVIRSRGSGSLSARLAAEMLKWITVTHPEMAPVGAVQSWVGTPQGRAAVEFVSMLRDGGVVQP